MAEVGERTRAILERTYEMMQEASHSRSYQQRMIEKRLLLKYCFYSSSSSMLKIYTWKINHTLIGLDVDVVIEA